MNCISRIVGAAIAAFALVAGISAQGDALGAAAGDRYVISAKAGGVNYVSGSVAIIRTAGKSGLLLKGDKVEVGDRISTGADGRAEILLNPGSYLRLGPLSAFEFKTTDLDDLQIALDSGSAMFEVFATEDFAVTVRTPQTEFKLIDSGVYRIDARADGTGKIAVWKGKAQVGDDENARVKSGREAVMVGAQASINKFDRDEKDELEQWSKDRAKELAKITDDLQRDDVRTALMRSYLGRRWNMYDSFGLWVWDPFRRMNCFLPFGWGWGSPYGYGFGHSIWYYNLPPVVYNPPPSTGGGNDGPPRGIRTVKPGRGGDAPSRPPFAQVQGSSGSTGRTIMTGKPGRNPGFDPSSDGPIFVRPSVGGSGPPSAPPPSGGIMKTKPGRP